MKRILLATIFIVAIINYTNAQFTFSGYKDMKVENNNKPDFSCYLKGYHDNTKYYKYRETYYNWEPHFLRVQELRFNEDGTQESLSEIISHYEDFSDDFIEKKIKEIASVVKPLVLNDRYYLNSGSDEKNNTGYEISVNLGMKVFPSFIFGTNGTLSSAQFDNCQYLFSSKSLALEFFKTLKDKKWDGMLDLTDAPKRITTTYVAYTSVELEISRAKEAKEKAEEEALEQANTSSQSSSSSSSSSSNSGAKTEVNITLKNKSNSEANITIVSPGGGSKDNFSIPKGSSKSKNIKVGAKVLVNGSEVFTAQANMDRSDKVIMQ